MPEQGLPLGALEKALTAVLASKPAIWNALQDDKVFQSIVPPSEDPAEPLRPQPYLVWATPTDVPHLDQSSAFGQAGSSSTLRLFLFTPNKYTKTDALDLADKIKRALSGKAHAVTGFKILTCLLSVLDCSPVKTGHQTTMTLQITSRTV